MRPAKPGPPPPQGQTRAGKGWSTIENRFARRELSRLGQEVAIKNLRNNRLRLEFAGARTYVAGMKRLLLFTSFLATVCLLETSPAMAKGPSLDARAIREDYRRLQSQLEDLLMAHNALKSELSKLRSEVQLLRAKTATKDTATATRDDLEGLAKSIREVDRKRVQDKDLILKEMKALLRSGSSSGRTTKPSPNSKKSFEHTVQKDETISAIIAAYNADLKSQGAKKRITLKSVLDANPKLNPRTMRIGQTLFIPDPR
jgi:septal ring factor EnvC (AmiA/AmiB activator)